MKITLQTVRSSFLYLALAAGLASTNLANAQTVPPLVNYQGRLANPDGTALATGDYTLTFRVYDHATNSFSTNLIWGPQVFDGVAGQGHGGKIPVVQGYFNVMLGPVDTNGVSLDTAFNGTNRYVEIRVSTNNPILPRQQILSAPFAFNSAKLAGSDWSAVFGTNDPVNGKIPTTKLATNGTIIAQQIGVGTTSPSYLLDVSSSANNLLRVTGKGTSYGGSLLAQIYSERTVSGANGLLSVGSAAFPNTLFAGDNGNVGIGMTSPAYKLNVRVSSPSTDGMMTSGADGSFLGLFPSLTGGSYNALVNGGDCAMIFSQGPAETGNLVIGPYSATAKGIKITSDGRVGVGISAPSYKLDVQGVVHALDSTGGAALFAETRNANVAAKFAVQHPGGVGFGNGLTLRNLDSTVNNVTGIVGENASGVAVAGMEFVNVNHFGVGSRRGALSLFTINSNTTSRVTMTPEGSVGIGTADPQAKLEVTGDIRASNLFFGGSTGSANNSLGNGALELGNSSNAVNTPLIDFHYGVGSSQDYNVRIINDQDGYLTFYKLGLGTPLARMTPTEMRVNGAVVQTSDRDMKDNVQPVSPAEILAKVTKLPVSKWSYKDDGTTRHLGPMAQDFYAAFGLGTDDRHIAAIDSDGVALAAIQGLNQKLEAQLKAKDAEIEALKAKAAKIDLLEQRLADLERRTQTHKEGN
jgi:hypothetical protein